MAAKKKLYRSEDQQVLGGVCGGLAEYFSIDVTLVRIIFVLLGLNGMGVALYFILWVLVPTESMIAEFGNEDVVSHNVDDIVTQMRQMGSSFSQNAQGPVIVGVVLVALGAVFLLKEFVPWVSMALVWPVLLIAFGIYILLRDR